MITVTHNEDGTTTLRVDREAVRGAMVVDTRAIHILLPAEDASKLAADLLGDDDVDVAPAMPKLKVTMTRRGSAAEEDIIVPGVNDEVQK